ncbi:ABC transporter permease [Paenibacillus eucommiae]|uniref:Aldouronate transport system permease protein n=1 Tax=Paenibacillus eucommiae TaxID=1355755 RepID=A0ABS4IQT8_9BACL|nr:ABC transporter permease subunit [Paenibacillus eucommiae]MBP1989932.1 putative aldouronate transport system permease protein [Paenibacillus eucommiae]
MKQTEANLAAGGTANIISTSMTSRHRRSLRDVWKEYKRAKYIMLLLLPAIIWYSLFYYAPFYGVQIAFKDYNLMDGIAKSPWVGLDQFKHMFTASNDFGRIIRNTIIISFYHIVFGFPAPIVLALLFNELRLQKFKRITQSIMYLPHFLSWVVLAGLLTTILSPSEGIVNFIIKALGFKEIYFMGNPDYFRFTLVVSAMWKEVGWGTIIYLAALAGVNPHLYEAAVMDGANRWKQTLHITLPQILPVISIMFILRIGSLLDAGFDQILNMYNPAVYSVSDILDTYVYRAGILQLQYSFTTAVGLFKNVIAFAMVLLANYLIKKSGQEGLF